MAKNKRNAMLGESQIEINLLSQEKQSQNTFLSSLRKMEKKLKKDLSKLNLGMVHTKMAFKFLSSSPILFDPTIGRNRQIKFNIRSLGIYTYIWILSNNKPKHKENTVLTFCSHAACKVHLAKKAEVYVTLM
ncbi:hypothetical protein N9Y89_00270 [bacterium]|nr:hypothetical protein [bacterium]